MHSRGWPVPWWNYIYILGESVEYINEEGVLIDFIFALIITCLLVAIKNLLSKQNRPLRAKRNKLVFFISGVVFVASNIFFYEGYCWGKMAVSSYKQSPTLGFPFRYYVKFYWMEIRYEAYSLKYFILNILCFFGVSVITIIVLKSLSRNHPQVSHPSETGMGERTKPSPRPDPGKQGDHGQ
jgi:hypothetical protein